MPAELALVPNPDEVAAAKGRDVEKEQLSPEILDVIEGVKLSEGRANVADEALMANIRHAVRQGHPQAFNQAPQGDVVAILGGGPSLEHTVDELREVLFEGALLVTVNGAYQWAIEHNFKPKAQVVCDARESNARFVDPEIPDCRYYLASQCHPQTWAAVKGRPLVGIYHAMGPEDSEHKKFLDSYYLGNWQGVAGGTTVTSRALGLLRMLGYLRFHLFGVDSCFFDRVHHAYAQPENDRDKVLTVKAAPTGHDELERSFQVAPWHLKQVEDMLRFIKVNGDKFLLNIHGDGLLAHVVGTNAQVGLEENS